MKMNRENMARFEDMVKDWANDNNLAYEIEHDWDNRRTAIRFKILETRAHRDVWVYWDTKKSLSQAGAIVFSHMIREFDLDSYNNAHIGLKASDIEKVVFNDPATIVLWKDGTKTVVKRQDGDVYSEELGLAMCIAKKALGNKGNYNDIFKKWIPESKPNPTEQPMKINMDPKLTIDAVNDYLDGVFKGVRERICGGLI